MGSNNSLKKIFLVSGVLCLVCSLLVSFFAVVLRPIQAKNQLLDKKRNILVAADIYEPGIDILEAFKSIETVFVDLETGKPVEGFDDATFDIVAQSRGPETGTGIDASSDTAGIKKRPKVMPVYFLKNASGGIEKIVLPIFGKGLWSTMYGFLALQPDLNSVAGITFYAHGETPGLGGEIDNANWQAKWVGKRIFDSEGQVKFQVIKGQVDPANPQVEYLMDGLAGATITARGVSNTVSYWFSNQGYGKFLSELKQGDQNG